MRIIDWSSDVCSSDLADTDRQGDGHAAGAPHAGGALTATVFEVGAASAGEGDLHGAMMTAGLTSKRNVRGPYVTAASLPGVPSFPMADRGRQLGRGSGWERVWPYVEMLGGAEF